MHMPSLFARVPFMFLVVSPENKDYALLRGTIFVKISGLKLLQWKTNVTIFQLANLVMSISMLSVVSLDRLSKRSMIQLNNTKLRRTSGSCSQSEWRILFGPVQHWPYLTQKFSWSVVRTLTETEKFISSMSTPRHGSPFITWINWGSPTNLSSCKTKSMLLEEITICHAKFMTLRKTNGLSYPLTTLYWVIVCTPSRLP